MKGPDKRIIESYEIDCKRLKYLLKLVIIIQVTITKQKKPTIIEKSRIF